LAGPIIFGSGDRSRGSVTPAQGLKTSFAHSESHPPNHWTQASIASFSIALLILKARGDARPHQVNRSKELQDPAFRSPFVLVLRGFKFTYADDDFAIKKIGISEQTGISSVDLLDRSGQNKFRFTSIMLQFPES